MTQIPKTQAPEISFTLESDDEGGRYLAHVAGKPEPGELTFKRRGENRILVDHVRVPHSLRGNGIATALARHLVAEARAKGFTAYPQCPFMVSQAEKNPDWADVIEPV
ncbi:GNAT family N-acetyltransferase [Maricaulis sp.]|uniref:GNAT family N-acetyltransferase n=1 Tax=Maricaulis sp. TaxID=1486257 RepID=UPI003A95A644